jgi:hypothetical protein
MPNSQFHTAISEARYLRYFSACGSKRRALMLYRANIKLSKELYGVIGVFEIVLRNSIDRHMTNKLGSEWLANAVQPGGYLEATAGCEVSYHAVQEAIQSLGIKYTHDKLLAQLTFGFWTYQFANTQYAASGSTLLDIFINRPFGTRQKDIYQSLIKINDLRNQIAHYEPICFDGENISIYKAKKRYHTIINLLTWLGCNPKRLLYGIDSVPARLQIISHI